MENSDPEALNVQHQAITIDDRLIHIHALLLNQSAMIWVNSSELSMKNLSVAMQTKFSKDATAINLLGSHSLTTSSDLAQRLCKRTNMQIFVSYNLADSKAAFLNKIEPVLVKMLM